MLLKSPDVVYETTTPSLNQPVQNTTEIPNPTSKWEQFTLMTKLYGDVTFVAFTFIYDHRVPFQPNTGNELFFIETEKKGLGNKLISASTFFSGYSSDKLFDVVNGNLYVINADLNSIDIYQMGSNSQYSRAKSLKLPLYKLGTVHGIKCNESTCDVETALHIESGCNLTLDIKREQFSEPVCWGPSEDSNSFIPEKL